MNARTRPNRAGIRPYALFRLGATIAIATVLALTSTVSFAAFTTTGALTGGATSAGLRFTTTGLSNLAVTYTGGLRTSNAWLTVSNTGGLPLTLSGITVSNTGVEALGATVQMGLWSSSTCSAKAPLTAFTTMLNSGTKTIPSSYAFTVPAGGSIRLCSDTQLLGSLGAYVTQTFTSTIVFSAAATTGSWTTTDTSTHVVTFSANPTSVRCTPGAGYVLAGVTYSTVIISWLEPDDKTTGYQILVNGVQVASTNKHARSYELSSLLVLGTGPLVVTIVAIKGNLDVTTEAGYIVSTAGLAARNISCA